MIVEMPENIGQLKIEVSENIGRLVITASDGMQCFADSARIKRRCQA